jgi:sugar phosphate permease
VAAPAVEAEQAFNHRGYALTVFVAPLLFGSVLEAGLALVSDRVPRRRLMAGALFALGGALAVCACARSGVVLSLGLTFAGTASGIACAAAQAELVAADPAHAERSLTRWVLFGSLGDLLTPLIVAAVFACGGSYRAAFWAIALAAMAQALALRRPAPSLTLARSQPELPGPADAKDLRAPGESDDAEDAPAVPLRQALQMAAANRRLWLWLSGCALCTLLDEIVVGLATLRMHDDLGFSPTTAATCALVLPAGGALGAAATEALLSRSGSTRVLIGSAAVSLAALGAALGAHSLFSLLPALFLIGVGATPQYGLLEARAYAAVPGQPGVVNGLAQLFVALDVAAPFALGALADRFGLAVALGALAVQPLGVMAITLIGGSSRAERD